MRLHFAILLLAASLSAAPALLFSNSTNASYTIEEFVHHGKKYGAAVFENQVRAFIAEEGKLVAEEASIKALLESYLLHKGYSPNQSEAFRKVHEGILAIKDRRRSGEEKCRVLLGTDRHTCESFESCLQACYSVTSFCQPVALGAGKPFINAIFDFEQDRKRLDMAYEAESRAYQKLLASQNLSTMQAYLSSLEEINRAATKASSSPLYDYYSYCFQPDYALVQITALQLEAQKGFANASPFFSIDQEAERILGATAYAFNSSQSKNNSDYSNASKIVEAGSTNASEMKNSSVAENKQEKAEGQSPSISLQDSNQIVFFVFLAFAISAIAAFAGFRFRKKPRR